MKQTQRPTRIIRKKLNSNGSLKTSSIENGSENFRLLGDDRKLPYGTSVLDKVRRTWRQLLLSEDGNMLVYRVTSQKEEYLKFTLVTLMMKM